MYAARSARARGLKGVQKVDVFLASEKAVLLLDPKSGKPADDSRRRERRWLLVPETDALPAAFLPGRPQMDDLARPVLTLFGIVFSLVVFVAVVGEWLGLFEQLTKTRSLVRMACSHPGGWLPDLYECPACRAQSGRSSRIPS